MMSKPTIFLLIVTYVHVSALVAQDAAEIPPSPEPNIARQSAKPGEDSNATTAEPNVTQPSQEPRADNNGNATRTETAEASRGESEKTAQKEPFRWTKAIAIPWIIAAIGAVVGVTGWFSPSTSTATVSRT